MKRIVFFIAAVGALLPLAFASAAGTGSLIKASGPAVYYVSGGKRYVFPNEKIFFSWYQNFDSVVTVGDEQLSGYLIGGNVTYRPASRLVKIQSDPKVYAVGAGGALRWVASEAAARALYGDDWNKKIDDVPDAFFINYRQGDAVASAADFDLAKESAVVSIDDDLAVRSGGALPEQFIARKLGTWSDPAVWGGKKPGSGARVVIPPGVRVIYDEEHSPNLLSVDVQGTLDFWTQKSVALSSKLITVSGAMTAGTEAAPVPPDKTAVITLTGISSFADPDDGLRIAAGGTLDLHGADAAVSWTHLAAPASKGDARIVLQDPVDWPRGSKIIIASTSQDAAEAETALVVSVDGGTVTLSAPLAHDHLAEDGLRAEVGLLSKNVSVVGSGDGAGSTVVVSAGGKAKISNAAFARLGRTGVDGAAPLEFDRTGSAADSYFKKSAIDGSGNRCVDLRQTNALTVEDVVAYDVAGHCFAAGSGLETKNVFRHDLAVKVGKGSAASGDETPAAFFFRNPDNAVENSAAAGGAGFGFWYWLADSVTRPDGSAVHPNETALGSFRDDAAHSNAKSGLYVDDLDKGQSNYAPSETAVFSGLRAAMNSEYGFWARGSNMQVSNALLAANRVGGSFSAFAAGLKDSQVLGSLDSASTTPNPFQDDQLGFLYQDGPVSVSGVSFRNFTPSKNFHSAALGFKPSNGSVPDPRSSLGAAAFANAVHWYARDPKRIGDFLAAVRDLDGGAVVTERSPFLDEHCVPIAAGNIQTCPGKYAQLTVALRNATSVRDLKIERVDSGASVTFTQGPAFDGQYAYPTVNEGQTYRLRAPQTAHLSFDYSGSVKPITLRFSASASARVKDGSTTWDMKPLADLVPGSWSYDGTTGEAVVELPPGGSVDVQW